MHYSNDSGPTSTPGPRTLHLRPAFLVAAILAVTACRFLPHPPNFTPVGACALFGGATFADRRMALILPISAMALSDLFLGFHALTLVVYACFLVEIAIGFRVRHRRRALPIAAATLSGSLVFFLVTNGACWLSFYPRTLAGLSECYASAIPFYANTLAGDVVYATILFGVLAVAEGKIPVLRERVAPVAA